jgi:ABC-type dipeptide/oligopeptide/nickel transport system ATPase component
MEIKEIDSGLKIKSGIKEKMEIKIQNINENIPHRNGFIYALCGSGGSGKSSLLLSMFKSTKFYRKKYDNIYLFSPKSSFMSVEKHPFENHNKVYHELNIETLDEIYNELNDFKENSINEGIDIENSIIIIDDYANALKDNELTIYLNKMIIKARHLSCCFLFTLQSYYLLPLILRKQITNCSIFKPKNKKEWETIADELLNLNKENALQLNNYIFDKPYNHLDIDTLNNNIYKNFNKLEIDYK